MSAARTNPRCADALGCADKLAINPRCADNRAARTRSAARTNTLLRRQILAARTRLCALRSHAVGVVVAGRGIWSRDAALSYHCCEQW
ncbi:hypothetical protein Acsp02_36010 [Actinoplanes sp. NBRC 103695]|nr:hypothetical protein Acsp02_36010 [Actinoplanes sp. NBRC 103695]